MSGLMDLLQQVSRQSRDGQEVGERENIQIRKAESDPVT